MGSKKRYKSFKKVEQDEDEIKLTPDRKPGKQYINWFPGHMNKAIKQIKTKLKLINIVLEIRDARLPLISSNPAMDEVLHSKNRLVVLNKMELADPAGIKAWSKWFQENDINYIFINALDKDSIQKILAKTEELVLSRYQTDNPDGAPLNKITMMMIGLPNTGKSTLINRMSGRNAARTADKPGHTQTQQWIKIENKFELLDTPGIMPPKIQDYEHGLLLAAVHAIPSKIVADEDSACFVVKFMLKQKIAAFQERYDLENLEMEYGECLHEIGLTRKYLLKKGEVDFERVYRTILADLRSGLYGQFCFELPPTEKSSQ